MALKNVVAAGLFPSLDTGAVVNVAQLACLNPPQNDVGMGDATSSPTPASKSQLLWDPLFTPDLSTFLIGKIKLKLS
jgi:hypothetical protein